MHKQCQRLSGQLFFTGYSPVLPDECPADLVFDRARQTLTRRAQPHSISSLCRKKIRSHKFDGDPFEYTSHVEAVLVNGQISYRRR